MLSRTGQTEFICVVYLELLYKGNSQQSSHFLSDKKFGVPDIETFEALADLADLKLITRFQDVLTASAATGQATDTGTQPNAASTSWSEADAQWASKGDLDW